MAKQANHKNRKGKPRLAGPKSERGKKTYAMASRKLIEAARENGKKGGRPKKDRHYEDFAEVAEPPTHPVRIGYWLQRVIALDAQRIVEGHAVQQLSREIRAYTHAISKLLRPIIILAAADPDGDWWCEPCDEVPPAQDDPAAMAYWLLTQLTYSVLRCIRGEPHPGDALRSSVEAYVKAIPPDALYDAQRKVLAWAKEAKRSPGPQPQPAETPTRGDEERFQPIHC